MANESKSGDSFSERFKVCLGILSGKTQGKVGILSKKVSVLENEVTSLRKQTVAMYRALDFYANSKNWEAGHKFTDDDDATIFVDGAESSISVDKGGRAYKALKAVKQLRK